jgi:hypothetical protein
MIDRSPATHLSVASEAQKREAAGAAPRAVLDVQIGSRDDDDILVVRVLHAVEVFREAEALRVLKRPAVASDITRDVRLSMNGANARKINLTGDGVGRAWRSRPAGDGRLLCVAEADIVPLHLPKLGDPSLHGRVFLNFARHHRPLS